MADRTPLAGLSTPELERHLTDLGPHLFPVTPDLVSRVRVRLERTILTPTPLPSPGSEERRIGELKGERFRGGWRVVWLAAALLLMVIAAGLAFSPAARTAIADRLGLEGVLIRWVDEVPTPTPPAIGAPLALGRQVTLGEAAAAVDFPVLVPTAASIEAPGEIYLLDQDDGAMVSFVYPAGPRLPESDVAGVGALLTQFEGSADRDLIEKGLAGGRGDSETRLDSVTVGGEPGFWISGAPHGVFFVCYDVGECREERYRLAGDVLLWEQDGLTLRFESSLALDEALAIAESVRAAE